MADPLTILGLIAMGVAALAGNKAEEERKRREANSPFYGNLNRLDTPARGNTSTCRICGASNCTRHR